MPPLACCPPSAPLGALLPLPQMTGGRADGVVVKPTWLLAPVASARAAADHSSDRHRLEVRATAT